MYIIYNIMFLYYIFTQRVLIIGNVKSLQYIIYIYICCCLIIYYIVLYYIMYLERERVPTIFVKVNFLKRILYICM